MGKAFNSYREGLQNLCAQYNPKLTELLGEEVHFSVRFTEQGPCFFARPTVGIRVWLVSMNISQLHGCCGIAVSYNTRVNQRFRRVGTLMHEFRKEAARVMGFTVLVCTDVVHNESQRKILNKSGFKGAFTFINRRTRSEVALSYIHL